MTTDEKRATSPNIFGMPLLSCIYWIILLRLNPKVHRFTYCGMRLEECEGTLCSYPLGGAIIADSRLTPVGFFTLLRWLTWRLCPPWRVTSILKAPSLVKGILVSELASVPWYGAGTSDVTLDVACGEGPADEFWGSDSRGYSCQASLGGVILEDSLRYYSFERVNFSWLDSSEWSSNIFFHFTETVPFLMFSTMEKVTSKTTWYWGKTFPVLVLPGLLIKYGMGNVLGILQSWLLVPTW